MVCVISGDRADRVALPMKSLLAIVASVAGIWITAPYIESLQQAERRAAATVLEAQLLPSAQRLSLVTAGVGHALAHPAWFRTISYFGKHYRGDRNYQWLHAMCQTTVALNPYLEHVYKFCGLMLAWELSQPQLAKEILEQGAAALPTSWQLLYHAGFVHYYFLDQPDAAVVQFAAAAQIPGAPLFLKTLTAKTLAKNNPQQGISFLSAEIDRTEDPTIKQALIKKRMELVVARDRPLLEQELAAFVKKHKRAPRDFDELLAQSQLRTTLVRPGPGRYVIKDEQQIDFLPDNHSALRGAADKSQ